MLLLLKALAIAVFKHSGRTILTLAIGAGFATFMSGNVQEGTRGAGLSFTAQYPRNGEQLELTKNGTVAYRMRQTSGTPGNGSSSHRYNADRRNVNATVWTRVKTGGYFTSNNSWIGPYNGGTATRGQTIDFTLNRTRGTGTSRVELQVSNMY